MVKTAATVVIVVRGQSVEAGSRLVVVGQVMCITIWKLIAFPERRAGLIQNVTLIRGHETQKYVNFPMTRSPSWTQVCIDPLKKPTSP